MKISVRVMSLVLIHGYIILTLFLFFLPALYANTDLSLAVQATVEGKYQNLLLGVRPLLIFIATLFPLPYSIVLNVTNHIVSPAKIAGTSALGANALSMRYALGSQSNGK